jgi:hypothetical protein
MRSPSVSGHPWKVDGPYTNGHSSVRFLTSSPSGSSSENEISTHAGPAPAAQASSATGFTHPLSVSENAKHTTTTMTRRTNNSLAATLTDLAHRRQ